MSALFGHDSSGNNNYWTPINFSNTSGITYDSLVDSPTELGTDTGAGNEIRGDYPTFSSNQSLGAAGDVTYFNGALERRNNDTYAGFSVGKTTTILPQNGKWYCEFTLVDQRSNDPPTFAVGIVPTTILDFGTVGSTSSYNGGYTFGASTGNSQTYLYSVNGTATYVVQAVAVGGIFGIAYDADNRRLFFSYNGTWLNSGNPVTGSNPAYYNIPFNDYIFAGGGYTNDAGRWTRTAFNGGQRPFAYTAPAGFKALNSKNLKDVGSFNLPDTFGNFVNTPDLVWIKNRGNGSPNHSLFDTVRGIRTRINSNSTNANSVEQGMEAFLPNGIYLAGSDSPYNAANQTYVSWMWNRGKLPGFDIVSYPAGSAGQSIQHNLGVKPDFIIIKCLTAVTSWAVYHSRLGATAWPVLSSDQTATTSSQEWNNTEPTSTHFTVGATNANSNVAGNSFIAYLWTEVPGFSKFGSYIGNGSSNGPMVHTGFLPRWIMIKRTDAVDNWRMYDTQRNRFNPGSFVLYPNLANAEDASTDHLDWLSNGFKIRSTNNNGSGGNYIYAAFAEFPFKYANAR